MALRIKTFLAFCAMDSKKHYKNYYHVTVKRNSNHDVLEFNILAKTFSAALKQAIAACKQHDHYLVSIQQDTFYKLSRQRK